MHALPLLPVEDVATLPRAELRSPEPTIRFMLAGNAHVTFQSLKTGTRFTYRVVAAPDRESGPTLSGRPASPVSHFVHVLTGPDHYEYLGCVYERRMYRHGRRSRVGTSAKSAVAFAWCWARLTGGRMPETLGVYHEGRCGACGRRLTTPESIESGLGPVCMKKVSA
jgi:hypothetical protein